MKFVALGLVATLGWTLASASFGQSDLFFLGKWRAQNGNWHVFLEDGSYEFHRKKPAEVSEGRWRYGEEICRLGRNLGNIEISRGRTDCCYAAKLDGRALKLSSVDPLSFSCFTMTLER